MWDFALNRGYYAEGYGAAGGTLGSTVGALAGFAVIVGLYFLFRKDILRQVRLSIRRAEPSIPAKKGIKTEKTSVLVRTILATSFTIIAGTAIFSIVNLIDGRLVQQRLLVAGFEIGRARELYGQVLGRFNPISNLPAAISSSLAIAMIPAIAAASRRGQRLEVRNKANTGLRVGMFLTMPIAFGLAVLGSQITALLFPGFPEGGTLFIVGFPSIIFLAASQIATGALQAIGKTIIPVYAALAGALAKIVSSYMLIAQPNINIYGAVIGTSVCYLVTAIINCLFLHRHTGAASDIIGIIIKPAFASAGMAAGVFTFYHSVYILSGSNAFAVAFAVLGGIVLYSVFLLLANVLKDEDILFLPKGNKILTLLKNKGLL
jgi:stage V sporulation protein B